MLFQLLLIQKLRGLNFRLINFLYMKRIFAVLFCLFGYYSIAQVTNQGVPVSWNLSLDNSQIQKIELPSFDLEAVKAEDEINDYKFDAPWRFGFMHSVDYGLDDGNWTTLQNGDRIWRLLITSKDALSLNFILFIASIDYLLQPLFLVLLKNVVKHIRLFAMKV